MKQGNNSAIIAAFLSLQGNIARGVRTNGDCEVSVMTEGIIPGEDRK